jgi:hypothetical protein
VFLWQDWGHWGFGLQELLTDFNGGGSSVSTVGFVHVKAYRLGKLFLLYACSWGEGSESGCDTSSNKVLCDIGGNNKKDFQWKWCISCNLYVYRNNAAVTLAGKIIK